MLLVIGVVIAVGAAAIAAAPHLRSLARAYQLRQLRGANLLVVTLDTTRADRLGCYGHAGAETPVLDGLARDGVLFERCITPTAFTLPSHSSIMTGLNPMFHGVRLNGGVALSDAHTTLAERLKESGYRTGGFVGAFVLDSRWGLHQGFETYDDEFDLEPGEQLDLARVQRPGNTVVDAALAWLQKADERPFFAWVHLYDPHTPYEPPEPYRTPLRGRAEPPLRRRGRVRRLAGRPSPRVAAREREGRADDRARGRRPRRGPRLPPRGGARLLHLRLRRSCAADRQASGRLPAGHPSCRPDADDRRDAHAARAARRRAAGAARRRVAGAAAVRTGALAGHSRLQRVRLGEHAVRLEPSLQPPHGASTPTSTRRAPSSTTTGRIPARRTTSSAACRTSPRSCAPRWTGSARRAPRARPRRRRPTSTARRCGRSPRSATSAAPLTPATPGSAPTPRTCSRCTTRSAWPPARWARATTPARSRGSRRCSRRTRPTRRRASSWRRATRSSAASPRPGRCSTACSRRTPTTRGRSSPWPASSPSRASAS